MNRDHASPASARRIRLDGQVQGVGFRPFVYRLATELDLTGWVRNELGEVEIHAEGPAEALAAFEEGLIGRAPPLARPRLVRSVEAQPESGDGFEIVASEASEEPRIHVPPDYYTCDDCVAELRDPADRRYRYPFINCTQCGPRYTLIRSMPYDRPNTSMAGFPLCADCRAEYEDPGDRRFHAEPVACPACGPALAWRPRGGDVVAGNERALESAAAAIATGSVVAVKGVGGYHLVCDAANEAAVARLRRDKPRPHKPLAVMFPATGDDGLDAVRAGMAPRPGELELLAGPERPIVLMRPREDAGLADGIAPGLAEVGVMLPYSPLHHLLLAALGRPLVATSGNISGEPVLTDAGEVEKRIARMVDGFLHHDRPIVRPADDPVYRQVAGRPRPLRLGRGNAPLELELPLALERPLLATGAHMKNAIALAWDRRLVVSPHIGDMGTARSVEVFGRVVEDLQALYGKRAEAVVCDAHPDYATTRWARASGLPAHRVHHHVAHAALAARNWPEGARGVAFTWDGVGLGRGGMLWGGEAFLGRPGDWIRYGSFRAFRLPGGERAGREPWRSAAALCWETGRDCPGVPEDAAMARRAWERGLNAPETTAAGRLFDAAAALTGLCTEASFEGQGPMYLEAASAPPAGGKALPLERRDGTWVADWEPLLDGLADDSVPVAERASVFHDSLALTLLALAERARADTGIEWVGLGGGVFQNDLLASRTVELLERAGFRPLLEERLPVNDGGLCAGQIIELAAGGGEPWEGRT